MQFVVDPNMEMTPSNIFQMLYSYQDTLFYAALDSEHRQIVDVAIQVTQKGHHPKDALFHKAYKTLCKIFNVDFGLQSFAQVFLTPSSEDLNYDPKGQIPFPKEKPIKNHIACTSYSCGSNLSNDYEYANAVEFASCSSSSIPGMYCIAATCQTQCPVYKADQSLYASYQFSHDDINYDYTIHTYRHIYGDIHYQIFDQDNNLINELKFDSLTHLSIDPNELSNELKSIVKEVHHNIFYSESFPLSELQSEQEISQHNKKSYLATLIS
jgi:hypothetical protein